MFETRTVHNCGVHFCRLVPFSASGYANLIITANIDVDADTKELINYASANSSRRLNITSAKFRYWILRQFNPYNPVLWRLF
jgi:hypothetical protein